MNTIYVDFEALSNPVTIVSIGAVDSRGREFYKLIRPFSFDFGSNKNTRILELTGLNINELRKAQNVNQVFGAFATWVNSNDKDNRFVFYGESDKMFLLNTLKECGERGQSLAPQVVGVVSNMILNYRDASSEVAYINNENRMLSQVGCIEALGGVIEGDVHNALDDAKNLKLLCSLCDNEENRRRIYQSILLRNGEDINLLDDTISKNNSRRDKVLANLEKKLNKSIGLR